MPRRLLKRITPHPGKLQERWFLRLFGPHVRHPGLWSLKRRSVTGAFAAGLAICFVPLPVHLPLAALVAIAWRLNLPTIFATVFIVNPFTAVPIYYCAYRVGAMLLGDAPRRFRFHMNFDWLQYGLGPIWKPFLIGCLVCAALAATFGWIASEMVWRARVRYKYRRRGSASG